MTSLHDSRTRIVLLTFLVIIGIFSRLLPHPPNFTAIAAVALFAGAHFKHRGLAFVVPFIIMFISDLIIGLHNTLLPVYLAFAITVGIGIWISSRKNIVTVAGGALVSSVLFFLITNLAVWMSSGMYAMNLQGLITCFTAAIPFFHYTLAGDLFFTGILFGGYYLLSVRYPQLQTEEVQKNK